MSSNNSSNESPNHFIVLDAISRGMKKVDSIVRVTKLSKDEVELIVNDLNAQKLITKDVKKGFFGNKKIELYISETGMRMLSTKKQELSNKSQHLQQLYETGERGQMQSFMDSNRMWMPMMLFSGIMSVMFFASMMSFMGMAMNPAESSMTEGQVDETGGAEDTGDAASDSGGDVGAGDAGAGDAGAGGMDMDAGGFDSF
ncbi:MAG: MarR family transcriptional regulator [Nitrosopumilus sp.]|nr:MarR family transcriptional regulator [Nitrosopumilus sp.]